MDEKINIYFTHMKATPQISSTFAMRTRRITGTTTKRNKMELTLSSVRTLSNADRITTIWAHSEETQNSQGMRCKTWRGREGFESSRLPSPCSELRLCGPPSPAPERQLKLVDEGDGWMNHLFPRVDDKWVDGNTYTGRGRTCYVWKSLRRIKPNGWVISFRLKSRRWRWMINEWMEVPPLLETKEWM